MVPTSKVGILAHLHVEIHKRGFVPKFNDMDFLSSFHTQVQHGNLQLVVK
jgi:hypothetical protein